MGTLKKVLILISTVILFTIIFSGIGFTQGQKYIPYTADPKRTALIIIDMQYANLEPGALLQIPYPGLGVLIPNHQKLISFFRKHRMPIIWVAGVNKAESHGLMWTMFPTVFGAPTQYKAPGRHETEIIKEIAPLPDDIVVWKNMFDAFWGTNLESILRTLDIEYTAFTGVSTTHCVSTAIRSAFHRQFKCYLISDATGARTKESTEHEFAVLRVGWARVMNTDEFISELETKLLRK